MAKRWNKLANDDLKKIKIINEAKRVSDYRKYEVKEFKEKEKLRC